jgi:hypothetical protein
MSLQLYQLLTQTEFHHLKVLPHPLSHLLLTRALKEVKAGNSDPTLQTRKLRPHQLCLAYWIRQQLPWKVQRDWLSGVDIKALVENVAAMCPWITGSWRRL